jgi:hypothetical protein
MRKDVINYPNYRISSKGYVINKATKKKMATSLTEDGYVTVRLTKDKKVKRFRLHRLVAIHFIPNPENKEEVNHIDGDKLNNGEDNLEWHTRQENATHAKETGLYTNQKRREIFRDKNNKKVKVKDRVRFTLHDGEEGKEFDVKKVTMPCGQKTLFPPTMKYLEFEIINR